MLDYLQSQLFEDYLEKYFDSYKMMGLIQDKYFIDIGIPEDFEKAKKELS